MASTRESDTELARSLLAGEAGAFDRFVELFRSKVFQYSYLMCGQREDAEEVAQDTLLKVFENLEQLREPEHVKSWVFRIAKNACLMKRRKSIFAPPPELSLDEPGCSALDVPDHGILPELHVIDEEAAERLRLAIIDLPERLRSVVLLRDFEDLSTEETAVILGVSGDAVKTRLHRARLTLRNKFVQEQKRSES